jgi:thiamine kinase-like enzyme
MDWSIINREGYGAQFNRLSIKGDLLKKEAKNAYGEQRIENEIVFLKFIIENGIQFPIPHIESFGTTSYTMKYYTEYQPLSKIYKMYSLTDQQKILDSIYTHLSALHESKKLQIIDVYYKESLYSELIVKVLDRIKLIEPLLAQYSYIKKVNNLDILPLTLITEFLTKEMYIFMNTKTEYFLCPIHGDCQFNNILINKDNQLIFIDPRGYYGTSKIYGIPEYDFAKVEFALSGYDIFDSMTIESLHISNDTIFLEDLRLVKTPSDRFSYVLALSIWLGNAHCFIDNPAKAFYSYSYAMWLCSLFIGEQRNQNYE